MAKPRILVVEDETGIAETICYVLETDGFDTQWCSSGADALEALQTGCFALAVLDVGLPDINGFDLFRQIHAKQDLPAIFLTARGGEIDRVVGLELGADDYISKPFSPRELSARVRTVLRRVGKTPSAGSNAIQKPLVIDGERRKISYYGRALELSRYEYGLLKTLISKPGRVFSREELLALVWDEPGECFDRTIDSHVKTLRAKLLGITPTFDPIITHRGVGYSLAEVLPAQAA
ncbi:MAG: transcriptional regulator [Proteobacteria bacterium]|nr:transcriptional regulator [Pseudomonadota bacterium]